MKREGEYFQANAKATKAQYSSLNCRSKLRYFHQLGLFQPPKNALAPKKNGQTFSRSRKNRTFALLNSVLTALRIGIEYEIIKRKQQ